MVNKLTEQFLNLSRINKQLIMLLGDIVMLTFALWAAFSIRLGAFYIPENTVTLLFIVAPLIAIPIFIKFGLYRAIVRYIGFKALWTIIKAVSLYAIIWAALVFISGENLSSVPRSVTIINWLVAIILIGGSRMMARWWFVGVEIAEPSYNKNKRNVAIYGAGTAGRQLVSILDYSEEFNPVAFLDDESDLQKSTINSLHVYSFNELDKIIPLLNINEIFLALPSASHSARKRIIQQLEKYPLHVRTLPKMSEVADGKIKLEDIKEVDLEDLLGRDAVLPDKNLFDACIKQKTVMVTGAGGSIGSELCRQIITSEPEVLVLFERSEYNLYKIEQELEKEIKNKKLNVRLVAGLGDVTNYQQVSKLLALHAINTIYHAAAYKHVPLVEHNEVAGLFNNVFGTYYAAKAAKENNVETFILISTDKAVRPTNVMGASKRFAELVLQGLATQPGNTKYSMVRFGNVLGSSGSVVPLFREQIIQGGPVTVTHKDIIRYFMTIPEASQLVIQAGAMGTGGDVFVLDMGEPVKIADLAIKMIHLMGFTVKDKNTPDGDIEINYTGLRPGEKLYEELLIGDNAIGTSHPRIMRAEEEAYSWKEIEGYLASLDQAIKSANSEDVRNLLVKVVKGYQPGNKTENAVLKKDKVLHQSTETVINLETHKEKNTKNEL